ncbi:MAG: glycosyltransferase, partial [Nitrospinota bacterium]
SIFSDSYHKIDQVTKKKGAEACIRSKYTDFLGEMVIAKAVDFAPDLIISIAQAPLSSRTLARLKQAEIPIAFWFVEDFRTLTYWREIGPHYDYFFSIQQGEFSTLLAKAGVKKAFYLPQACFPPTHTKLRLSQDELTLYGSDISFVGAGYYNRQKFFPGLTDFDFKIWGSDWSPSSALFPDVQMDGKRVEPAEYVKIFNASLINLNLHSSLFHEGVDPTGDFVNPRTFELASCGAFQLVDYRTELPELFEIDKEVACFRDLPDLKEKIGHYLAHPEERTAISKQARRRALKEHSFISRLHQLLTVIWLQEKESIEGKILEREAKKRSVNSVSRMLEEARGDEELSHFLAQFKEEDSISLSQIMDAISRGKGAITRPEAIFMMINEVLTEKNEEGTYS